MNLRKAERRNAKIKLALQGPSGSGKTYSALQIAKGLTEWNNVVIIDTENHSADLYDHLGGFNVIDLVKPYSPEKYIQAIDEAIKAGMKVIIIDSLSHEWEGEGGILDIHSHLAGNSFTNWAKVTPRHNALVQAILNADAHVIATFRTKQDYVLTDKNGKMVPEKVGLKSVTRDGMDYEFTIVFDIDIAHNCAASKDRTGIFVQDVPFRADEITGKRILNWCESGAKSIKQLIAECKDIQSLKLLYYDMSIEDRAEYHREFIERQLELKPKFESNGVSHIHE
jgi:nucleoside-triphosphatase THEP1